MEESEEQVRERLVPLQGVIQCLTHNLSLALGNSSLGDADGPRVLSCFLT